LPSHQPDISKHFVVGADHSNRGYITNNQINQVEESNESPEAEGSTVQNIEIEDILFHLLTDKIVINQRK